MQQVEDQIQQFIEVGQLELAYQLMLSLDKSEPAQAFVDIIARSLPSNEEIYRLCHSIYQIDPLIYIWEERIRVVMYTNNVSWNKLNPNSIFVSVYLQQDNEQTKTMDEFHIYHPDNTQFMLQQIYEMIELNAAKIVG